MAAVAVLLEAVAPVPLAAPLLVATCALNVDSRFANSPPLLPTAAVPAVALPPGAVAAAVIMRCALNTEIWFAQRLALLIDASDIRVPSKKLRV